MAAVKIQPDGNTSSNSSSLLEPHEQTPLLASTPVGDLASKTPWQDDATPVGEQVTRPSESVLGKSKPDLTPNIAGIISVLLLGTSFLLEKGIVNHTAGPSLGVFIANVDTFLVIATYSTVSSELGSMENGSWLVVAYSLAMCAIQPTVSRAMLNQRP